MREEAGIEIEKPKYLTDLVFIRPDGYPVATLSYYAKWPLTPGLPPRKPKITIYKSGEVKLNHELIEGIAEEIAEEIAEVAGILGA